MAFLLLSSFSCYLVCLAWVVVTDLRSRIIPNSACIAIVLVFFVFAFSSFMPFDDLVVRVCIALIGLALGAVLFSLGFWGGGDAKLASVVLLWIAPTDIPLFLIVVALIGGLQAFFVLIRSRLVPADASSSVSIPYGVALVGGALSTIFL